MTAPGVASVMVTVCVDEYDPGGGLKLGLAVVCVTVPASSP